MIFLSLQQMTRCLSRGCSDFCRPPRNAWQSVGHLATSQGLLGILSFLLFCKNENVAVTVRSSKGKKMTLKIYCYPNIQVQALHTQKLSNILGWGVYPGSLVPCSDSWYPVCNCLYTLLSFLDGITNIVSRSSPIVMDAGHTQTKSSLYMRKYF